MTNITQTRKRSGRLVPFEPEKISNAMQKAFVAVKGEIEDSVLQKLTDNVVEYLDEACADDGIAPVEETQNIVEKVLMDDNYFDVAKSYIIFRYEHAKTREENEQTAGGFPVSEAAAAARPILSKNSIEEEGEIVIRLTKEDSRFGDLLDLLENKQLITKEEKQQIFSKKLLVRAL